ncbi:MAG: hypothetical protein ACPGWS_10440 [Solirubrobacterales bacterium]
MKIDNHQIDIRVLDDAEMGACLAAAEDAHGQGCAIASLCAYVDGSQFSAVVWKHAPVRVLRVVLEEHHRLLRVLRPVGADLAELEREVLQVVRASRECDSGALEDFRVVCAQQLFAFFGQPASCLSARQVLRFALHLGQVKRG